MTSTSCRLFAVACALTLAAACKTAPEVPSGQPVVQGSVTATVVDASLRWLDLEGPTGAVGTSAPLFVVEISVSNSSGSAVTYDLGWTSTIATQAQAPLLFVAPAEGAAPTSGTNIPAASTRVYRDLNDPVTAARELQGGETLTDILLFHAPPEGANNLVLSLPPRMFGPEIDTPAYVRITAPAEPPTPPAASALGEVLEGPGVQFAVTGVSTEWVPLLSRTAGEGFAEQPLLRIDLQVTNTSEIGIEVVPVDADRSMDPPALITASGAAVGRAEFPAAITAEIRPTSRQQIGAGEARTTSLLFDRPPADSGPLMLVMPGVRVGSSGLFRVQLEYTWADPTRPDALTPRTVQAP
ncbi:MAG: hypothetical protein ACI81R_001538, partial [Bradymonadia bacterium]|jgi:hypothetical protein